MEHIALVQTGPPCPECVHAGPRVGWRSVAPHRPATTEDGWRFCATAGCPVVFYLGAETVTEDQVRTRVDHKALAAVTPTCFCFSHIADEILADRDRNGTSTIKADIKVLVNGGLCSCEFLNPDGVCCLPAVRRVLKGVSRG